MTLSKQLLEKLNKTIKTEKIVELENKPVQISISSTQLKRAIELILKTPKNLGLLLLAMSEYAKPIKSDNDMDQIIANASDKSIKLKIEPKIEVKEIKDESVVNEEITGITSAPVSSEVIGLEEINTPDIIEKEPEIIVSEKEVEELSTKPKRKKKKPSQEELNKITDIIEPVNAPEEVQLPIETEITNE